jgi:hypothetical protein
MTKQKIRSGVSRASIEYDDCIAHECRAAVERAREGNEGGASRR